MPLRHRAANCDFVQHRPIGDFNRGQSRESAEDGNDSPLRDRYTEALLVNVGDRSTDGVRENGQPIGQKILENQFVRHAFNSNQYRSNAQLLREVRCGQVLS